MPAMLSRIHAPRRHTPSCPFFGQTASFTSRPPRRTPKAASRSPFSACLLYTSSFGKSVVIAKGNEDLVAVVNEVINKVTADGSYQKAYDEAVELAASLGL